MDKIRFFFAMKLDIVVDAMYNVDTVVNILLINTTTQFKITGVFKMAFCKNCGCAMNDTDTVCPKCGVPVGSVDNQTNGNGVQDFVGSVTSLNNTPDTTAQYDQDDINNSLIMGILCYIPFLVFVPVFTAKNSAFTRFHANQGIVLFIADVIVFVLTRILGHIPLLGGILNFVLIAVISVLGVIGIYNVYKGKAKELPVIGSIRVLK